MEKSSQIAWEIVPLRHFFPQKVVPLIEVLLHVNKDSTWAYTREWMIFSEVGIGRDH
jgi:hypothetical protein